MVAEERKGGVRAALALSTAISSVVAVALVLELGRASDYGVGLAFDLCCIGWAYVAGELLRVVRVSAAVSATLLGTVLVAMSGLVVAHAWYFDVAIERRLTLLDLSLSGLVYFFTVSLPPRGLFTFLALIAGIAGGAVWLAPRLRAPSKRVLAGLTVGLTVVTIGLVQLPKIPSPLYDSAYEFYAMAVHPRVSPSPGPEAARLAQALDKHGRTRAVGEARFSKVIVVVMETMTAATFAAQRQALPQEGFFTREKAHLHSFERYYPNNQDSRTGMLDMLFSRLIPYEAYSDEGYAGYSHLADRPSLVERMRALSFASAFAVSQTTLEDVVDGLSWDATLRLDAAEITRARATDALCFTPDEYEQSCEDLVLLPEVVEFVAAHERAFVYQEMIWGHAYEYNAASGLTNAAYYERYLDALSAALDARGLLDDTLIAITSDHGFRDKGRQHDPEVYRVPLFFFARRFSARSDTRLTSHSDFGMLLFEALAPASPRADDNPLVMITGPTGQGHTFVVDRAGGHLLLWRRLGGQHLLAQEGALSASPGTYLATFEAYRARFDQEARGAGD